MEIISLADNRMNKEQSILFWLISMITECMWWRTKDIFRTPPPDCELIFSSSPSMEHTTTILPDGVIRVYSFLLHSSIANNSLFHSIDISWGLLYYYTIYQSFNTESARWDSRNKSGSLSIIGYLFVYWLSSIEVSSQQSILVLPDSFFSGQLFNITFIPKDQYNNTISPSHILPHLTTSLIDSSGNEVLFCSLPYCTGNKPVRFLQRNNELVAKYVYSRVNSMSSLYFAVDDHYTLVIGCKSHNHPPYTSEYIINVHSFIPSPYYSYVEAQLITPFTLDYTVSSPARIFLSFSFIAFRVHILCQYSLM